MNVWTRGRERRWLSVEFGVSHRRDRNSRVEPTLHARVQTASGNRAACGRTNDTFSCGGVERLPRTVSEDEQEITRDRDEGSEGDGSDDDPVTEEVREIDEAADSFLEVEQELDAMAEGMQLRGQAIDVEQISASEVPGEFPYDVGTGDALALTLEVDQREGKTVTTYFQWPGDGSDERLGRLLELCGVPLDRFADLHGEELLLEVESGHFVPVVPDEEPRGDDRAYWGILAGLFPSVLVFVASLFQSAEFLVSTWFFISWLVATFVVLPIAVYFDAWHLRTTTNWEGGPLFWAALSMIPGLNVVGVAGYLIVRENAEPII